MSAPSKESVLRSMKRLWRRYIHSCRRRNIFWEIELDLFHKLTSQNCSYCGKAPSQRSRTYTYNGIDRMDDSKGYMPSNVVPCCYECNFIKGNRLTYNEMRAVGQALANYRKSRKA